LFRYVIKCVRVDSDEGAEKHPQLRCAEHGRGLVENPVELGHTRLMQLLSPGSLGFLLLLFPFELPFTLFGLPLLLLLVLLPLLFVVALAFLGLFLCLDFGRGCHCWGGIGGLFFLCSRVVYGAIVVCAYGELKARLEKVQPRVNWPAASTFGNILHRAGLTNPRQKKRRTTPCSEPFSEVTAPNQLWCMDFKGYFSTGDGTRCDPFTITDAHSRYLIRCQTVSRMDLSQVVSVCEAAMREYGMPARIRTDNGAPFAGTGLLGLSKLSLSWTKMGIVHERIQPGRPQQNGRHERMHRTLKEDTTKPPALTLRLQQKKFDRFRQIFNHERPHEGLNNETLASLYQRSSIMFPRVLTPFTYPRGFQTRRVNTSGDISWHKDRVFISQVFSFEDLGFEEMDEEIFRVYFREIELGELDVTELRFRPVRALP
jgi:transposase InsO family protein